MGNVKGLGSRVERLASGTSISATTSNTLVAYTGDTLPSWVHTIQLVTRIDAISGAPTNFQLVFGGTNAAGTVLGSGIWAASATVASPGVGTWGVVNAGRDTPSATNAQLYGSWGVSGSATAMIVTMSFLPRNFNIKTIYGVAPTTVSQSWALYGIGG